jgi:hypothetical protein
LFSTNKVSIEALIAVVEISKEKVFHAVNPLPSSGVMHIFVPYMPMPVEAYWGAIICITAFGRFSLPPCIFSIGQ